MAMRFDVDLNRVAVALLFACTAAWASGTDDLVSKLAENNDSASDAYAALRVAPDADPAIVKGLHSSNAAIRMKCVRLAGERRGDLYPAELKDLLNDNDAGVRREVVHSATRFGIKGRDIVLQALKSKDSDIRLLGASALEKVGGTGDDLKRLRNDPDPAVRMRVALKAARAGDQSVREEIVQAAKGGDDRSAQLDAINALGYIANPADVKLLEQLAKEGKDGFVRRQARDSLRRVELGRSPDPTGYLDSMLRTGDFGARRWAAAALVGRNDPQSQELAKRIAADTKHPGRTHVLQAMAAHGE